MRTYFCRDELEVMYATHTDMIEWFNITVGMHVLSTYPTNTSIILKLSEQQEQLSQLSQGFNSNRITFEDNLSFVEYTRNGAFSNAEDKSYFLATYQQCERIHALIDQIIIDASIEYNCIPKPLFLS